MRLVIDSNQLQSPELREFLGRSLLNYAVLTDFAAMEAYKGNTLNSIYKSMAVVSDYPNQVLILKGSRKNFGMSGRRSGLQRRFIDETQTREFPGYVRKLHMAQAGNLHLQKQILEFGRFSDEHFAQMLSDAREMRETFDTLGKAYSKEERAIFRNRSAYTPALAEKMVKTVLDLCGLIFGKFQTYRPLPTYNELSNTFVFRITHACYLLAVTRAAHGGVKDAKPEKIRNDIVDMTFVAYGTYFDGILSGDVALNSMFSEVCILLRDLFDAEVPAMARLSKNET